MIKGISEKFKPAASFHFWKGRKALLKKKVGWAGVIRSLSDQRTLFCPVTNQAQTSLCCQHLSTPYVVSVKLKGILGKKKIFFNLLIVLPVASSLWIQWDRGMTMECSWDERVYYPACSPSDKSSTRITSAINSLQVCNPPSSLLLPRALYIVTQSMISHCLWLWKH